MAGQIVAGTDGSAGGTHAVDWAACEATRHTAGLLIVHTLPTWAYASPPGSRHPEISRWWRLEGHRLLKQTVAHTKRRAPGLDVRSELLFGDPAPILMAASESALMVVVGHGGLGEMRGLLLGSVGLKLAGRTACPLVVAGHVPSVEHGEILVGLDTSHGSLEALRFAFAEAERREAALRVLRVLDSVDAAHEPSATAQWQDQYPTVKVQEEIAFGHPARVLADVSASADLVVVGSRGLGGFTGLVLGSVSHGVLHHARCPVVVVPPRSHPS